MQEKIYINWSTFKRVFALNPTLIFNTEKIIEYLNNQANSKIDIDESEDEVSLSNQFEQLHELILDYDESNTDSYIEILASNYPKYKQKAEEFLIKTLNLSKENIKVISLQSSKDIKIFQTIEAINNSISLNQELLIINPVIGFDKVSNLNTFTFLYNPFALHIKQGKIIAYLLSYTSTSKPETYYLSYYLYWLSNELGLEIYDIKNIIIDPRTKIFGHPQKNKINFLITQAAWMSNSIVKSRNNPYLDYINDLEFFFKKSGLGLQFLNKNYENDSIHNYPINYQNQQFDNSFISCAKNKKIVQDIWVINKACYKESMLSSLNNFYNLIKYEIDSDKYIGDQSWKNIFYGFEIYPNHNKKIVIPNLKPASKASSLKEFYEFEDFSWYLSIVIKAYEEFNENINLNALLFFASYYDLNEEQNYKIKQQINYWLKNHNINYQINYQWLEINDFFINDSKELIALLREYLLKKDNQEYIQFSGKFKQSKNLRSIKDLKNSIDDFKSIPNSFNLETLNIIKQLHIKDAIVSWYDYEGFSDIFPPVNGIASYNQVVCQVSVITTKNGIEQSCENIVKDPKNISCQDFIDIIDSIYRDGCDYYVVYNKGYENTRNSEILKLVKNKLYKGKDLELIQWLIHKYNAKTIDEAFNIFANKIHHINSNTIDLADVFTPKKQVNLLEENIFYFQQTDNNIKQIKLERETNSSLPIAYIQLSYLKSFYSIKKIEKFITENNIQLKNMIFPYSELKIQKGTMAMKEAINRFLDATNDSVWEYNIVPELKKYCENDVRAMIMVYDLIMYLAQTFFNNISDFEYKLDNTNGFVNNGRYQIKDGNLYFDLPL